jgi:ABC-type phosphate transport system substrate-binding protein
MLIMLLPSAAAEERQRIVVVVHPSRSAELTTDVLGQIYLRRKRFWDDGAPIVPLNLTAGTPLRDAFARLVLRDSEARLAEYWNRQYFYGILPPATLQSTQAVVRYVAADPNAIGYVPADEVDGSVRVVLSLP